ncbi:MAG: glycosyltransferase family 39 protein [Lachnospiraceae bacterium]|nr:glycosyltransferase family 39 protein [Lachnospiraceae bacterium]
MNKWKRITYQIFAWIFFCAFLLVFGKVLFGDVIHYNNTITLLLYLLIGFGLVVLVYNLLNKYSKKIKQYYKIILAVFLVIYGIIILVNGFLLRFTPAFDMDAIYGGARQWVQQGSFPDYYDYFGYFPNNLGSMTVLHFVFSIASIFGISDFFAVGIVFNTLLLVTTIGVVSLTCKKLRDEVAGVMALVFFVLCVPFLFMGAAFYTDSLSLLFPALFYYLYLHFKEQKTWKKRIIFAVAMAAALTVGMLIKFTVLIILVAVVIDALLTLHWKEVCLFAGSSLLVAFVAFSIMNAYIYSAHLDKDTCKQLKTPYLHWVMMGMQNNGYYSPEDYEFTRSLEAEERNAACLSKIKERIDDMKFSGLTELFMNKSIVCFGDGTFALSDFLDDTPDKEHWLHKYILYAGEKYGTYRHFTTGMLLVVYLFMLLGGIQCLREKEMKQNCILAPRLACLGILAFLLLWETSGRYFTNFIPFMLICAVLSLEWKIGDRKNV